ncbi:DUF4397 domain-containing protein [Neptunicella marina]|uniref:DUF4397 domain-containing protein n=1 Tax=Neptunicella marina TaxID=2125989 RepID=A0A8J6IWW1_9ALTE|nr:DUF4397 domain-containing protein [Neptunicella marina]MBC3767594.1 DUF4397 domain-containing protein [Neptunicella marina]
MNALKVVLPLSMLLLIGCGGSDDDESDYAESYMQFYNGSANSANTYLTVDDSLLSSASYGDATTVYTFEPDDVDIEFSRVDSDGQSISLKEQTVSLKKGYKKLLVLSGDYQSGDVTEYDIERKDDYDDEFDLYATNMDSNGQGYDLYMAESGTPFSDAHLVASTTYQSLTHGTYWDADSDSSYWVEDEYVFYITSPGSDEVLFQSQPINMTYSTEYVAVIRQGSGPTGSNLVLDLVNNSSSVASYTDIQASSQFRVYNSLNNSDALKVTLAGNEDQSELQIEADTLTEFSEVDYGDYRLTVDAADGTNLLKNKLITLNQGDSKTILLFNDADGKANAIAFSESTLPQIYDHDLNVANLVDEYSSVDFYFVRQDETIDTAEYKISSVQFAENDTISLPTGYYEIIAVYEKNSDDLTLLYRSSLLDISEQSSFVVTLEPDQNSATGYKINLLH